jgi:hypothetical protein
MRHTIAMPTRPPRRTVAAGGGEDTLGWLLCHLGDGLRVRARAAPAGGATDDYFTWDWCATLPQVLQDTKTQNGVSATRYVYGLDAPLIETAGAAVTSYYLQGGQSCTRGVDIQQLRPLATSLRLTLRQYDQEETLSSLDNAATLFGAGISNITAENAPLKYAGGPGGAPVVTTYFDTEYSAPRCFQPAS